MTDLPPRLADLGITKKISRRGRGLDTSDRFPPQKPASPRGARGAVAQPSGGLNVEDRVAVTEKPKLGLAAEFRSRGFPGEVASMPWGEYEDRAVTWQGSVDNVSPAPRRDAAGLGYDQRHVFPAFGTVAVDAGTTSVPVFTQTARPLAAPANVVRSTPSPTSRRPGRRSPLIRLEGHAAFGVERQAAAIRIAAA